MRSFAIAAVLATSALALAACGQKDGEASGDTAAKGASASGPNLGDPMPKAGLWEQTMSVGGMQAMSMKICLDDAMAKEAIEKGNASQAAKCTNVKRAKLPTGGFSIESTCEVGEGVTASTKGVITGNMTSAYRMEMTTSVTGPNIPKEAATQKIVMDSKLLGPCPPGMNPGVRETGGMIIDPSGMKPQK